MSHSQLTENTPCILLVDDEPSILFTLAILLEEEGYRVISADHGRDALSRLAEELPDLIITDFMMPYLTGAELIEAVRAEPKYAGIPILIMSAALPAGIDPHEIADAYLQKPADLDELLSVIKRLLQA
ncbi:MULTISPECIES: response regulator [Pseudomonas]|uniref:response regulator n=1 Tax=Pseudomonas TaxID=286 RepID=UPI0012393587|nr:MULTISPECIES: response regulator [Pseudomonas]QIB50507.1 response regulator [Pseudomonas sp. OIL-1]